MRKLKLNHVLALVVMLFAGFSLSMAQSQSSVSVTQAKARGADGKVVLHFSKMPANIIEHLEEMKADEPRQFSSFDIRTEESAVIVVLRYEDMSAQNVTDFFQSWVDKWMKEEPTTTWNAGDFSEPTKGNSANTQKGKQ